MDSVYFAKVFGIYFIVIGMAYVYRKEEFINLLEAYVTKPELVTAFSAYNLLIGLFVLFLHPVFLLHWSVLITLIALLIVAKGVVGLLFPEMILSMRKAFKKKEAFFWTGVACFLVGLFLSYHGFLTP